MNFTRSFFASVLGTLTAFGLLFVILLLIISAAASIFNASSGVRTLSNNSILNLDLNLPIVERPPVFDEIQSLLGLEEEVLGLPNILSTAASSYFNGVLSFSDKFLYVKVSPGSAEPTNASGSAKA